MKPRIAAAAAAALVALLDVAQVVALPWRPKHWGALAGAALYVALAAGAARGSRVALGALAAMPLVPLSVLALSAAGVPLPVAPDVGMVVVLAAQLAAAGAAARGLTAGAPAP